MSQQVRDLLAQDSGPADHPTRHVLVEVEHRPGERAGPRPVEPAHRPRIGRGAQRTGHQHRAVPGDRGRPGLLAQRRAEPTGRIGGEGLQPEVDVALAVQDDETPQLGPQRSEQEQELDDLDVLRDELACAAAPPPAIDSWRWTPAAQAPRTPRSSRAHRDDVGQPLAPKRDAPTYPPRGVARRTLRPAAVRELAQRVRNRDDETAQRFALAPSHQLVRHGMSAPREGHPPEQLSHVD